MRVFYVQPDEVRREVKNGNGTTGPYTFSFSVQDEDSVGVQLFQNIEGEPNPVLTSGVDFTVVLAAPPGVGGDVFTTDPVPIGQQLVITSEEPYTQETVYVENDPFPAKVTENALDKLTVLTQQNRDLSNDRGVLQSPLSTLGEPVLLPLPEAGKYIRWADDLKSFDNVDLLTSGAIGIPVPISQGGTNATTAAGARGPTNLNVLEDVLTTEGDLLVRGAAQEERLPVGAQDALLSSDGQKPVWVPRPVLAGYIQAGGGELSRDAGDPDHDVNITPLVAVDDAGQVVMTLDNEITKQIDANWAVGDDAGGLDTGTVAAHSLYYVWLIRRPDTGVRDVIISLSRTSPTLPANYTQKRRVGFVRTDQDANLLPFLWQEDGNYFWGDIDASSLAVGTYEQRAIPPGVEKIECNFGFSVAVGNLPPYIQIGDSGGLIVTGYDSIVTLFAVTTTTTNLGFALSTTNLTAAEELQGRFVLQKSWASRNDWWFDARSKERTTNQNYAAQGRLSLANELDRFACNFQSSEFDLLELRYQFSGHPNPRSLP